MHTSDWPARIRAAFGPRVPDDDIVEELAQHASATYETARAEGLAPEDAAARVADQIRGWVANPGALTRRPRRVPAVDPPPRSRSRLAAIAQDTRYALRLMRRQPAHTAIVAATMALGIAATTTLGSIAYGVLLKPLPWADAPRLVRLYETRQGSTRRFGQIFTNGTYLGWRDHMTALDAIGAWSTKQVAPADHPGAPRIPICDVTPSLFPMLEAKPLLGRMFVAGDELAAAADADDAGGGPAAGAGPSVVILSYGLWQQQFGGRANAIGSRIRFDSTTYTVVGVMPPSFAFPDRDTRAWRPFHVVPPTTPGQQGMSISMFQAIGRLKPGATPAQAAAEGTSLGRAAVPHTQIAGVIAMAVFGSDGAIDVTAVPMLQALTADVRPAILVLLAAVALLLATATANVASLQLARATARRRELAIRSAIGAGRGRLVRQTLVEHLLLGLLGGAVGLALAGMLHRALPSVLPPDFPRLHDIAFGWRIQAFAVAISILAGLGCGVLPALHVARTELVPALVEDSLAPIGAGLRTRTARARAVIMAAQIAIACVLLVGGTLLARSFIGLMNARIGYDPANVLTARVILTDGEYSPERRFAIADQVMQRLAAVPGVLHAAYSNTMTFAGGEALSSFPLKRRDGTTAQVQTGFQIVSPDYFAAMGQRVVQGRAFSAEDQSSGQPVAIVNREFSRKYLDTQALGWHLPGRTPKPGEPPSIRPIIGVVEDAVRRSVTDAPQPEIYQIPSRQQAQIADSDLYLIVRTSADPRALVPTLRDIVRSAAPSAPLESVMTLQERVADSLANPRLYATLLAAFALFALAIAGVGLFGVLSYSVAQRVREIGVRCALGATAANIVALVARQSLTIVAAGLVMGLLAAFWAARLLASMLYGVTTHDLTTFAGVAVLLAAVALVATLVPARRAASVDPIRVLRG